MPYPIFGPNQKFHSFPIKSSLAAVSLSLSLTLSLSVGTGRVFYVSEWESDLFHAITINPTFVIPPLRPSVRGRRARAAAAIQKMRRIEQVTC